MTGTMFGVEIQLFSSGGDPADHFEHVVDCYAKLEASHEQLLDVAFSYSALSHGTVGRIEVEVTVAAGTSDEATAVARSAVRSAIHDAGGSTPDWDAAGDGGVVVYRLVDEDAQLVS